MNMTRLVAGLLILSLAQASNSAETAAQCPDFLNHEFKRLHSTEKVNLCTLYHQKPMVIVNTASHCGYTRQFKGLEALYRKYKAQGVEVVGFASDDFKQAAKSEEEAATICYKNYGVTFTMLAPTQVRGDGANAVFAHLNEADGKPSWNFNKYLVSADGKSIQRFGSNTEPMDSKLEKSLQQSLKM